jgi:hypothetical protein
MQAAEDSTESSERHEVQLMPPPTKHYWPCEQSLDRKSSHGPAEPHARA